MREDWNSLGSQRSMLGQHHHCSTCINKPKEYSGTLWHQILLKICYMFRHVCARNFWQNILVRSQIFDFTCTPYTASHIFYQQYVIKLKPMVWLASLTHSFVDMIYINEQTLCGGILEQAATCYAIVGMSWSNWRYFACAMCTFIDFVLGLPRGMVHCDIIFVVVNRFSSILNAWRLWAIVLGRDVNGFEILLTLKII